MLQRGTYKKGPLELAQRMALTRQFGGARNVLPYSVGLADQPITLTANVPAQANFRVGKVTRNDSLFVADSVTGITSSAVQQAILYDQGKNPLADAPLINQVLFGGTSFSANQTPFFPAILEECIVVQCPSPITCQIQSSASDVPFNAVLHGRIIEKGAVAYDWFNKRRNLVFPYWMTTPSAITLTSTATPATATGKYEIKNGNWYFQGLKIMGYSTVSNVIFTLTDPISKQVMMNGPVNLNDTTGSGALPTVFSLPMFLKPNSRLVLEVTNTAAEATQVWIAIFGRKIYARNADEAFELGNAKEPR